MEICGILVFVSLYLACAQLVSGYYVFRWDYKAYYEAGYTNSGVYVISPDNLPLFGSIIKVTSLNYSLLFFRCTVIWLLMVVAGLCFKGGRMDQKISIFIG